MNYDAMLDGLRNWDRLFGGGIPSKADIEATMRGEVDEETRLLMRAYGCDLSRGTVIQEAATIYRDEWTLDGFEKEIADFLGSVPAGLRAVAKVELKGDYDETAELVVRYERPQTDEEWAADVAHALMHARKKQADDRADYERLSRKFQAVNAPEGLA